MADKRLGVACAWCGALPGQRCHYPSGKRYLGVHELRHLAWYSRLNQLTQYYTERHG